MEISNKTLAVLLLAAVAVSLGGTIFSLNKLGDVTTTGYATDPTGKVNLSVGSLMSITTADAALVDFGTCYPDTNGAAAIVINSEDTLNTINCSGFTSDNISVRNDGNVDTNVTIQFSDVGENAGTGSLLASTSAESDIAFKIQNYSRDAGSSGGCSGIYMQTTYLNATAAATKYAACSNLTYGTDTLNSFVTQFQIVLPYDAPLGVSSVTVTYNAHTITGIA